MIKDYKSKSAPFIELAKQKQGRIYELGLQLQGIEAEKIAAIMHDDFEEAARFRQQEVELIEQIEMLIEAE